MLLPEAFFAAINSPKCVCSRGSPSPRLLQYDITTQSAPWHTAPVLTIISQHL